MQRIMIIKPDASPDEVIEVTAFEDELTIEVKDEHGSGFTLILPYYVMPTVVEKAQEVVRYTKSLGI